MIDSTSAGTTKKRLKFTALLLSVAFFLTVVWLIVSPAPALPIRQFAVEQLTAEEIAACSVFKTMATQPRHSQLERVKKFGIFPVVHGIRENSVLHTAKVGLHIAFPWWFRSRPSGVNYASGQPTFMMTREDVTDLLGEPNSSNANSLQYHVGFLDGEFHIFSILLRRGHVVGTGGAVFH